MSEWRTIPNETPIGDISGLKVPATTRAELNRYEAENIRKVAVKYLAVVPTNRLAPFDLSWMKRLHREMFGEVWSWAGEVRQSNTNIGDEWPLIEQSMLNLELDLQAWRDSGTPSLEQAARLHHRSVSIHPFPNGNGRWARMLANIWLMKHHARPTEWPEEHIASVSTIRDEYLRAIRQADSGNLRTLIELHERFTPAR